VAAPNCPEAILILILSFLVGCPTLSFLLFERVGLFLPLVSRLVANPPGRFSAVHFLPSHNTADCSTASLADASPERPAFVTSERVDRLAAARQNEVQIARSVLSFQISRHHKRRIAHPFFQKGWGTLVLSLHGLLRKWYPLFVSLRQADRSGKSNSPPSMKASALSRDT